MSRALSAPRWGWISSQIQQSFGVSEAAATELLLSEDGHSRFTSLLLRPDSPARLFVYYQPRDVRHGPDDVRAGHGAPVLFCTLGTDDRLRGKALFFLRNSAAGKAVDVDKAYDSDLLAGEMKGDVLQGLQSQLAAVYEPALMRRDDAEWGKADSASVQSFKTSLVSFRQDVAETLESLDSGVELQRPDASLFDLEAAARDCAKPSRLSPDLLRHFEGVLESWCETIAALIGDRDRASTPEALAETVAHSEGPRGIITYWRQRMQKLTSIVEQLKKRECRIVISVMTALLSRGAVTAGAGAGAGGAASAAAGAQLSAAASSAFALLRRWKAVDITLTEATNEAKDNVKYLSTLTKFVEPLYTASPLEVIDALPALFNAIKMIHTIARYFNTPERMTDLFVKITHALIANCKAYILDTPGPGGAAVPDPSSAKALWNRDVPTLIARLEDCLKLNEAYNEDFRLTKQSLAATPAARKMEGLGEDAIFRTFDLFCRRVIKLVDTFATTAQFDALAAHNLEGLEPLLAQFSALLEDFKRKRHDLLAYADSAFDRDYVELNVRVGDLEIQLQRYINAAFASITSIEAALALLSKFTAVLQRESMREDLDSKMALIFTTFGHELDMVQAIYDKHKHSPPIARNMPPVAGNITWARHLLRRIEQPMAVFKQHPAVLQMKDARRIVKQYNKVARVLYAFEYLWLSAWVQSIETAKAGLQATLIIRHPDDGRLYVNLDAELLQLIREAKCLDRMGVDVPESAKVVLLQEAKYKQHFGDLAHALQEYARITGALIPVTAPLLKPALQDLEYRLRPGMITLTWTSMNIESYKASVASGLARLEELVHNVNDIVENRIESNLKLVSRTLLVDLPSDKSFSLDEFVALQEGVVTGLAATLQSKNVEVESAVTDLVHVLTSYPLDKHIERVSGEEIARIRAHYQHFFYAALLNATKASLNALKRRVSTISVAKAAGGAAAAAAAAHQATQRPFFETEVKLQSGEVRLSPSIDDVQHCINRCAKTLLSCSKIVYDWDQSAVPEEARRSFFDAITKDIEVVRVVLLLTGSLQSLRQRSAAYLTTFERFSWLWTQDVDAAYDKFIATAGAANGGRPSLEDYERELNRFGALEEEIAAIPDSFPLGALNLSTATLKHQLAGFAAEWKVKYSENLHRGARSAMAELSEYIKTRTSALSRPVDSLDSLRFAMLTLQAIRAKEASIDADTQPILDMYALLEHYLPPGSLSKEEMDEKSVLRSSWRRLLDKAVEVSEGITRTQAGFRKRLLTDVRTFVSEVAAFRADYLAHGPMVEGVPPQEAMERLRRYEDEFELRNRKRELYNGGEDLFALPTTEFPELDATSKELQLLGKLYSLYKDVMSRMDEWRTILWADVVANVASMSTETEGFASRCKKLPKKLRQWPAFQTLNKKIEDFQTVLPLLQELSKDSMRPRHWEAVAQCTTGNPRSLPVYEATFSLAQLLATPLVEHKEEVEEICDLADKQLAIEIKLKALSARWDVERFVFSEWKNRGIPVLQGVLAVVEELEASQMDLQTILASRAVAPFREQAAELLKTLSDTSETLELWLKVQLMWSSLEGVFLSGDIARQMPRVATRFQKIDKDWQRMMATAQERGFVVECCANEILRLSLPGMFDELEKCQKALEGYLENKRALFPRFYFVSNPVLLQILSQGSDPQAIQAYYEKVFDSISCVEHDKKDKALIREIISREGSSDERITLRRPVKAAGNIEDWLGVLLAEMRRSMKELAEEAANEIAAIGAAAAAGGGSTAGLDMLRGFVDGACGQYSLLGLQLMWTADCQQALEAGKAGKKNAMRDANDRALAVLSTLSSWCLQDLGSKMNRTKIETLVTIQVHQRDVINDLYGLYRAKKVAGADDFAWQQQCRFYWQPDGSDTVSSEGACKISITDVDFQYQYEYLGCKERLVITPLTDRCYITLAQAMGMHFGGAPAGPAGTGKTETTKDMGRALGIYVVVTNCSSEMMASDCSSLFKGLAQAGLWGCFDEFNRILLEVLSVVAQQVLAVQNAKKSNAKSFMFPGEAIPVPLDPVAGFFITMNPGYAGRQELPENLKALFRGVAMMVPDREIIMKVKLCSVGYSNFTPLARKFFVCYQLCEEQLSKQKHYDFGLRNILSVLRTAGATKRANIAADEEMLLYRTLRDMNLSKLVAQDVPLFLSMLADLFPSIPPPPKSTYPDLEKAIGEAIDAAALVSHPTWVNKIVQLHETCLVRHGVMLVGAAAGGKTRVLEVLQTALTKVTGTQHKIVRLNPKAVTSQELFGQTDPLSGEWETGVFAAIWQKFNNRELPYNTWITCDGPVDTLWIESLNTVLDDNKLLTLASGDRIPMTENTKMMFEVESLHNASPATVSRAGIVYVSDTDLDWLPVLQAWIRGRPAEQQALLSHLFTVHVGTCTADSPGHLFEFLARQTTSSVVLTVTRVGALLGALNLLKSLLDQCGETTLTAMAQAAFASVGAKSGAGAMPAAGKGAKAGAGGPDLTTVDAAPLLRTPYGVLLERLVLYTLAWAIGGLSEPEDRVKIDAYLRQRAPATMPQAGGKGAGKAPAAPTSADGEVITIYELYPDVASLEGSTGSADPAPWKRWVPPAWSYPAHQETLDFSNLLVPTMDSTRSLAIIEHLHRQSKPVLLVGGPGTAKTSTALMFFRGFDPAQRLLKRVNFSSATTPGMFQTTMEAELDKRSGKSFGPPGGKRMTVFLDDLSMPQINAWGDQPTVELVRQLIEAGGFYFLDKDKRGDFKTCEDLQYIAAMQQPVGGRNDIPARLKRHFFAFNLVLPSLASIDDLYGQMLRGRFPAAAAASGFKATPGCLDVVSRLTTATIELWRQVKGRMLPTPAKFHYIFNMRELSRVFQGVLFAPRDTIKTGGQQTPSGDQGATLLRLWKHECGRVFQDKLTTIADKKWYSSAMDKILVSRFGAEAAAAVAEEALFVDFMRDDVFDEDDVLVAEAPKIYEDGGSMAIVRARVQAFMAKHNEEFPARKLELVLFDDALRHLVRIARILAMPRGSALLVGVGGSGKQSLTRLAAYIARQRLFQITLTKSYGVSAFRDDLRAIFDVAGHQRKPITFLFTDAEIKDEAFLEFINSILLTGDVAGLFAKDEMLAMSGDLRAAFVVARPGVPDTPDNLKQFFTDSVRDNLHVVLCMSPVNVKFSERARRFPGLISGTTIDWFLPWPEEALVSVARGFLSEFPIELGGPPPGAEHTAAAIAAAAEAGAAVKEHLMAHMGAVHSMVVDTCEEYFAASRRHVYQTPKSFLSFLRDYKTLYAIKLGEIKSKEERVNLGLRKLIKGAQDVEQMKVVLAEEQKKLQRATEETNRMLGSLEISTAEAEKESAAVAIIKANCQSEAARIKGVKDSCEADLAKAQPFVDEALVAINSIKPAHITEVKAMKRPSDIIRMVFDGVLVLFHSPLAKPTAAEVAVNKKTFEFIAPSWTQAVVLLGDTQFLKFILDFPRDTINDETVELLKPYMDLPDFNPKVAKAASAAAEGLCTWVRSMSFYQEASKIVKPKLEALQVAEAQLAVAMARLHESEERQAAAEAKMRELKAVFDAKIAEKRKVEENARSLKRRMEQASSLIRALDGERERWSDDSATFADVKKRLLGDCAVASAFISYCGPFNAAFRTYLISEKFIRSARKRGVPVSADLDVTGFLVDVGTVGDWNLQGLPTDPLSIQNGILVSRSSRYPLLVDPQGQALHWIRAKAAKESKLPLWGTTTLVAKDLRDQLEFTMSEGLALIIAGVEEEIDPLLDPVLAKQFVKKGRGAYVTVSDKQMAVSNDFNLYFISRLPNPHFSPELQAKVTVIDFTVTMKGLEEQLLGRVIAREQKALEDLLAQVLAEVNENTKALLQLDALLLERLTSNSGNLLDDDELVDVLANTKAKAAEVKEKLVAADETRRSINEKREQFRPVATRGSVLYFSIVEMSLVNVMYQTSLAQFIELFTHSMAASEKAALASKRVANIVDAMTYIVYRYINRGLYERDKLLFVFIVTVKTLVTAGIIEQGEVGLFLRGGAALDISSVGKKKPGWLSDDAWLNVIALSEGHPVFKALPDNMYRNEGAWRRFYEANEPDAAPVPDYQSLIADARDTGPWMRLLIVRALRMDRTLLAVRDFIRNTPAMGERFVEPVTDTMESIYEAMAPSVPAIFLLSQGADPTDSVEQLAKKKKTSVQCVSMGQGQEPVALKAIAGAAVNGTWVLLQNCELGLSLMETMEDQLARLKESAAGDFRLFITAQPHPRFPLGLLQASLKASMEPPAGMQAGVLRSYSTVVDQDRLERIDSPAWRKLVFVLCFLHSVVQERRKFGPLGFCVPYEFGAGDLTACLLFIEKHLYGGALSWPTVQYMVAEVQYGGKITDNLDRRLFGTYAAAWLDAVVLDESPSAGRAAGGPFTFAPERSLNPIPRDFKYAVMDAAEIDAFRRYAMSFPEIDSPELYGLHPNADLTFRNKEASYLLGTMAETQPKGSGGGGAAKEGGKSGAGGSGASPLEEAVMEKASELLGKLPPDYVEDEYRAAIRDIGGLSVPLNIFLFQEIQRLQRVIAAVRAMLIAIQQAIRGEVVMTSELQQAMADLFDARVPKSWMFTPGGDEFSWLSPTLGSWFGMLCERDDQFRGWLRHGRPTSFWIAGFSNPQGFLTAMKQEVTRANAAKKVSLNDMVYYSEVTDMDRADAVKSAPREGVYVTGISIDGARWDRHAGSLAESEPKKLFSSLPVLFVSACNKADAKAARTGYDAPLYRYPLRTDRHLITMIALPTKSKKPAHWTLRGVALLATIGAL